MDIEIIATVSSGVVALAAIVASALQHRRSLGHDRRLADLESVRGVLDDAAAELHKAAYAMDDLRAGLHGRGIGFFGDEDREKPYRALRRSGEALDRFLERLKIRLGRDHAVVKKFEAADAAALKLFRAADLVKLEDPALPGDTAAAREVRQLLAHQLARIDAEREKFEAAREQFVDAAQRAAGVELGA